MFGTVDEIEPDYHLLEIGELSVDVYIEGLVRRAPEVLGRSLDATTYMRFAAKRPLQVHWPVVHRIRELRAEGMPLALLTNNVKEFGDAWRASFPVDHLFSVVVDSSEVGMRKPDPRIYELTCELIGVEPAAAVFLDDNAENIAASTSLGIESVLVTPDPLETVAALDAILDRRGVRNR
jgi:epoxide hydrolase-like predicted phosphatase